MKKNCERCWDDDVPAVRQMMDENDENVWLCDDCESHVTWITSPEYIAELQEETAV